MKPQKDQEAVELVQKKWKELTEGPVESGFPTVKFGRIFPTSSFKNIEEEFFPKSTSEFNKLNLEQQIKLWCDAMNRTPATLPTYGDSNALVGIANLCNCRIYVLQKLPSSSLYNITCYVPLKQNTETNSISLFLRAEHFVIPNVDLEPLYGNLLRISDKSYEIYTPPSNFLNLQLILSFISRYHPPKI